MFVNFHFSWFARLKTNIFFRLCKWLNKAVQQQRLYHWQKAILHIRRLAQTTGIVFRPSKLQLTFLYSFSVHDGGELQVIGSRVEQILFFLLECFRLGRDTARHSFPDLRIPRDPSLLHHHSTTVEVSCKKKWLKWVSWLLQ